MGAPSLLSVFKSGGAPQQGSVIRFELRLLWGFASPRDSDPTTARLFINKGAATMYRKLLSFFLSSFLSFFLSICPFLAYEAGMRSINARHPQ